jgi:hypothetical protein
MPIRCASLTRSECFKVAYTHTRDDMLGGLAWGLLACIRIAQKAGVSMTDFIDAIENEWKRTNG